MFSKKSLRSRINIILVSIMSGTILLFGSALAVHEVQRRADALQQIELGLQDLTTQHQTQIGNEIFAAHALALRASLAEVIQRKGLLHIEAYDDEGTWIISVDRDDVADAPERALSLDQALLDGFSSEVGEWQGHAVLTFTCPLRAYGDIVGFWRVRYSLATLNSQTVEVVLIFASLILLPFLLIFLLLNQLLARFVWRPVYQLKDTMQIVRDIEGQTFSEQPQHQGFERVDQMILAVDGLLADSFKTQSKENEIASLAHSFRHMLEALKKSYIGNRTDTLTGLNNRLRLDEALQAEMETVRRIGSGFSILLLDIDKFKSINDTFGHLVGDQVLQQLSALLSGFFRQTDTPGRWGGEEFLVLLPTLTAEQAATVAERLRQRIETEPFECVGRCTVSIGVAQYHPGETLEETIARVDEALYDAKEHGRNRVALAQD
ncbi:MAG: diguanylate cyclase [Desulfovibrionaceae bacterium]